MTPNDSLIRVPAPSGEKPQCSCQEQQPVYINGAQVIAFSISNISCSDRSFASNSA
ncbi:hypothetical protein NDI37_25090 [Funiculus sociatus GB2-A5]|uniref:Uncharacterized protein n=1 Tax=Funiculus sociatus GB2-A5 TaxID=2933946 RepID=A0ABV0JW88_9CYAN|nr:MULTISPECIES: hypothetical protein [unclassified Trichocoleus]MBD1908186.1 hypothetical protein [Trichocoleus sp. FACHB-832]MBD2062919.1 hypothetical protein [Trichocoleus sp. FACHB-6]